MHVYFLFTNTEQKNNLNNTISNFKRSHEFNALGLVVKKTEEWVEDDNYHTINESKALCSFRIYVPTWSIKSWIYFS